MKKYLGQIIFNLVIAAAAFIIFKNDFISDSVLSIGFIILIMAVITAGNGLFVQLDSSGKNTAQKPYTITEDTFEKLETPQDYTDVMKKLTDYNVCSSYASKMLEQWETFRKKSETLDTLCSGGGVYDVVSKDVEEVMLRNMKLFMKRTAIIQSAARTERIDMHKSYLYELTEKNNKILNDYTRLLVEVSQMTEKGSDSSDVESLEMLINSIKNYRQDIEKGDI